MLKEEDSNFLYKKSSVLSTTIQGRGSGQLPRSHLNMSGLIMCLDVPIASFI